ncbi:hypothetical protein B4U80_14732, partial [Leptotrombidium deliense]
GIRVISKTKYFIWENGEVFDYENWATTEPNMDINANCISYRNGQWFASKCDEKFSVICEKTMASSKYMESESGSSLINKLANEMNTARDSLKAVNEQIKAYKERDNRLTKILSDIHDGKLFIRAKETNMENEHAKRTKRALSTLPLKNQESLKKDIVSLQHTITTLLFLNVSLIVTISVVVIRKWK